MFGKVLLCLALFSNQQFRIENRTFDNDNTVVNQRPTELKVVYITENWILANLYMEGIFVEKIHLKRNMNEIGSWRFYGTW